MRCACLLFFLTCEMWTDPRINEPPSYPAFPGNQVEPLFPSVVASDLPTYCSIAPTMKQEEYIHTENLPNGLNMEAGIIAPPAVPSAAVGMQSTIVDSPMTEVQSEATSHVQSCISDLLSSPHMLPCKHYFYSSIVFVV